MRMIALIGGGLDGLYLPVHPRYIEPPTHAAVYSPLQRLWLRYIQPDVDCIAHVDVIKLRSCAGLPTYPIPHADITEMHYDGMFTLEQQKQIEEIAQRRVEKDGFDYR